MLASLQILFFSTRFKLQVSLLPFSLPLDSPSLSGLWREEGEEGRAHEAEAVDELDAVELCESATDQLRGDVAVGEGRQHLAPRELVPLEAVGYLQVSLTCIQAVWFIRDSRGFFILSLFVHRETNTTNILHFPRILI